MTPFTLINALATVARRWRDPDYAPRAEAVQKTLQAENRFTAEGIAFAVNQAMHATTTDTLQGLVEDAATRQRIGVHHDAETPFAGYADAIAVLLAGHTYVGWLDAHAPYLLRAFFDEVGAEGEGMPIAFAADEGALCRSCKAVIVSEETLCENADDRYVRPNTFGVGVLEGHEDVEALGRLAEDLLLHDGSGPEAVRLLWAPTGTTPDALLDVLQQFRQTLPAHPSLDGALAMARGFLGAAQVPHAWGDGFLLSKGDPDAQRPGHIRWATYTSLADVEAWCSAHRAAVGFVAAEEGVARRLRLAAQPFGDAHRRALADRTVDVRAFLAEVD